MKGSEDKAPKTLKSEVSEREEKILEFWNKNEIFKKTLEKENPEGNFVFFDGPPFATGMPHYGHILPGTIKDVIPRYQTMKGKKVLRRWGWDCHGLPIENLIEKELGLSSKKDIEKLGVEKFNLAARNAVLRYSDEWNKIIPRSGRWIDMDGDYRTMDSSYTESVWWSFKTLYDKGLVYQGFKSMLLCPHCETTLSNFEVNLGYKDITDISVFVEFELVDIPKTYLIAWTTTPWTLPGNIALAINKDIQYVEVEGEVSGNIYIVAKAKVESVFKKNYKIIKDISTKELLGKKYKPVFDYYNNDKLENRENAWKIYHGDFVTTESGTGVVHIAPAFGEDDMNLGKENNLPFIQHVNRDGTFKSEATDFAGQLVKPIDDPSTGSGQDHQKADIEVIKYLAKKEVLFAKEKIVHSYPHCWRCNTPLLNYASTSWFVKVTAMKDRLVEINKGIQWTPPEIGEGRFGKWLEGARDWAISRSRYWGAPIPVWESESLERVVFGSIDELKKSIKNSGNTYFVMRHGETEGNVKSIWNIDSHIPNPLTEKGKETIRQNAKTLEDKSIDIIFVSPFSRTQETAKIVAEVDGLSKAEVVVDPRIGEWNVGTDFDGKSVEDFFKVRNASPDRYTFKNDGGECYADILKRAGEFLYDIEKKYTGKNILIVTHGAVSRALQLVSQGFSFKKMREHTFAFKNYSNAEIRQIDFVPLPHNEMFELDLHRPYIDEVVVLKDGKELKRIPEIFDTWYDSGSMPFAQQHYPFESKELFEQKNSPIFPADFIAEGLDQTRGWFYTLLVLGVGLFDKSPYQRVLVNGLVLAEDGRKMSKSLNNYPDVMEIINKYGTDSLRYYLMASPLVKAEEFNFSEKGVDEVYKKLIQKLYNVLSFYEMYSPRSEAGPAEKEGKLQDNILDDWIISRLAELTETISTNLDKYELDRASRPIMDFVDDLSTWYLRRSRDRFKSDDKDVRYNVSHYMRFVLVELSKVLAPFTPFIAEEVYKRAGGLMQSVHLENWPEKRGVNEELLNKMEIVRNITSSALKQRQEKGYPIRQPLASLTISDDLSPELKAIIADEVNVKEIKVGEFGLDTNLTEELKEEGIAREFMRAIQDARKIENLNPNQGIDIVVYAGEKIQMLIEVKSSMIKSPTQVKNISFSKEKQTHKISIEGEEASLSIVR